MSKDTESEERETEKRFESNHAIFSIFRNTYFARSLASFLSEKFLNCTPETIKAGPFQRQQKFFATRNGLAFFWFLMCDSGTRCLNNLGLTPAHQNKNRVRFGETDTYVEALDPAARSKNDHSFENFFSPPKMVKIENILCLKLAGIGR
jgi:hypothetical protein